MTKLTDEQKAQLERDAKERSVYDLRVLVVGGGFQYIQMFHEAGFKGATGIEDADIICFTGGEDVDPSFYGERPLSTTRYNTQRDQAEAEVFRQALALEKPMVGICRGSQFLTVMNDGKLWQHVNNHAIHGTHAITCMKSGEEIEGMTSTHHQMMIPPTDGTAEIIALASLSTEKLGYGQSRRLGEPSLEDVEVVWYPKTQCLAFQPHPEFGHGPCRNYFLGLLDEYILPAC